MFRNFKKKLKQVILAFTHLKLYRFCALRTKTPKSHEQLEITGLCIEPVSHFRILDYGASQQGGTPKLGSVSQKTLFLRVSPAFYFFRQAICTLNSKNCERYEHLKIFQKGIISDTR